MRLTSILLVVACVAMAFCPTGAMGEPATTRFCPVPLDARLIFNETMDALANTGVAEDCELQYVNVTSKSLSIGLRACSPDSVERIRLAVRYRTEVTTRLTRSRQPHVQTVANGGVEFRYTFKPTALWTPPVEVTSSYDPIAEGLIESCVRKAGVKAKVSPLVSDKKEGWTDARRDVTVGDLPLKSLWILLHNVAAVDLAVVRLSVRFKSPLLRTMVSARLDKRTVLTNAVVTVQTSYVPSVSPSENPTASDDNATPSLAGRYIALATEHHGAMQVTLHANGRVDYETIKNGVRQRLFPGTWTQKKKRIHIELEDGASRKVLQWQLTVVDGGLLLHPDGVADPHGPMGESIYLARK